MRRIFSTLCLLIVVATLLSLPHRSASASPMYDTYTNQPDGTSGIDTFMTSANATGNFGTNTTLSSGENNGSVAVRRALIKFDLSSIPANATITSATLSLWVVVDQSDNARDYKVYRSLRNWDESTATWTIYSTGNNWQTAGASGALDYDSTNALATTNMGASVAVDTEVQFSLSPTEIKKFVDGTYTNNGFIIKNDVESNDGYGFYSSDEVTKTTQRPKLVIAYTVPTNTPTITNTATNTATPTNTFTPTATNTFTPTATDTSTPTATNTNTPGPTATFTDTPVDTPTFTPTATDTGTPTNTPTATLSPTPSSIPGTPVMPTWFIDPQITYGEYMLNVSLLALCGVVVLVFFALFMIIIIRRKK